MTQPENSRADERGARYRAKLDAATGAERAWSYVTWTNLQQGYYSPDELIDLALQHDVLVDNPFMKIRRGASIGRGAVLKNGSVIEGEGVRIGEDTVLDQARIVGSNVSIGKRNYIGGILYIDNVTVGDDNEISDIRGRNEAGTVVVGDRNNIQNIVIDNVGGGDIRIGNANRLYPGLTLSNPFAFGRIKIGHHNMLGHGGGGLLSTAYRFGRQWGGMIIVGTHVEATRGAEILGNSLIGWPLAELEKVAGSESAVQSLFSQGNIGDIIAFLQRLWDLDPGVPEKPLVTGLYGVVRFRRGCAVGWTRLRDGVHVQGSYLRNVEVWDRCKLHFSVVAAAEPIEIGLTDRVIESHYIDSAQDWSLYPMVAKAELYPESDSLFYALRG